MRLLPAEPTDADLAGLLDPTGHAVSFHADELACERMDKVGRMADELAAFFGVAHRTLKLDRRTRERLGLP